MNVTYRLLAFIAIASASTSAEADSWSPPRSEVTLSASGQHRVTVIPRPLGGALPYFEDKVKGVEPAGQPKGEPQVSPIARVEQLGAEGNWTLVWQMPLVNDVAPTSVLLAANASFLVTFDNWHSAGYGADVVAIYDRRGELVRKLSLEQILPPAYVHHLPRSVSSRWWGGKHSLVNGDRLVELQVVQPGQQREEGPTYVRVRIRLADGVVIPPDGDAWERALARATELESQRQAAWDEQRQLRSSPLAAPNSRETRAWRHYMFELRERISSADERMGGMVLAAPGEEAVFHDANDIADWIAEYDGSEKYFLGSFILASPTSDRLAALLVEALRERAAGSMKGAHVVFVGTRAEGRQVVDAASRAGAKVTVVDRTEPFPPGEPLPPTPPEMWMPLPARF